MNKLDLDELTTVDVSDLRGSDGKLYFPGAKFGVRVWFLDLPVKGGGHNFGDYATSKKWAITKAERAVNTRANTYALVFHRTDGKIVARYHSCPEGFLIREALAHVLFPGDDFTADEAKRVLANGWANGERAAGREISALRYLADGGSLDDRVAVATPWKEPWNNLPGSVDKLYRV